MTVYDDVLGHSLAEYDLVSVIAADMTIRGDLSQKTAELSVKIEASSESLQS